MKQVVVPSEHRKQVLSLAYESIVSRHLAATKTTDLITRFHWPGITSDITRFCQSCKICQKVVPSGKVTRIPLRKMPTMHVSFHHVAFDLI